MTVSDNEKHNGIPASKRDGDSPVWDMSQERAFIENLLGQRFNFFLIFFSLVVAGALNAKSQLHFQIVLTIGGIICGLFAQVLARSQQKLDLILDDLFQDSTHPARIIDDRAKPKRGKRKIIGILIPQICVSVLVMGAIFAWFGLLKCAALSN